MVVAAVVVPAAAAVAVVEVMAADPVAALVAVPEETEVAVATVVMAEVVVPEATVEMAAAVVTVTVMVREVAALEPAVMAEPEQVVLVVTELEQVVMAMVMVARAAMEARVATAMVADRAAVPSHKIRSRSRSKPGPTLIPRPSCNPRSRFSLGPRPNLWYDRAMPMARMTIIPVHKIE